MLTGGPCGGKTTGQVNFKALPIKATVCQKLRLLTFLVYFDLFVVTFLFRFGQYQ